VKNILKTDYGVQYNTHTHTHVYIYYSFGAIRNHYHHRVSRIRPLGLFRFRIYFLKLMNLLHSWYDSLEGGGSARRKASTYTGQHNTGKRVHTSMPRVGFEHTTPVFERPKTVRASDRVATGTGCHKEYYGKLRESLEAQYYNNSEGKGRVVPVLFN
jgi:hypothetical protein